MPPSNTPALASPTAVSNLTTRRDHRPEHIVLHFLDEAEHVMSAQRSPTLSTRTPARPLEQEHPTTSLTTTAAVPTLSAYLQSPTSPTTLVDDEDENIAFLRDSLESLDNETTDRRNHSSTSAVDSTRDPRQSASSRELFLRRRDIEGDRARPFASLQPTLGQNPSSTSTAAQTRSNREASEDLTRRERLQRVLARLNRLHEPLTAPPRANTNAYANRTPSPNRQSLYDWAPASEEDRNGSTQESELEAILNELRRQQPETHPNILRVLGTSQLNGYSSRHGEGEAAASVSSSNPSASNPDRGQTTARDREQRRRESEWVNLRSRTANQSSRQGSPSARDRILRYVMDRERSGVSEEEERARGWPRADSNEETANEDSSMPTTRDTWNLPPPASEIRRRDRQERVEAFRRGYLAENMPPRLPGIEHFPGMETFRTRPTDQPADRPSSSKGFVENALKYISALRECTSYEEALSIAIDHGFGTKEFFSDKQDDFINDLSELDPLSATSWLQPGAVFEGYQYASNPHAGVAQRAAAVTAHVEQINPNFPNTPTSPTMGLDNPPGPTRDASFDAARPWLSHQFTPPSSAQGKQNEPHHDNWRVRVALYGIDTEKMTLQGTMEAYDVPQHPMSLANTSRHADRPKPGKRTKPITTYVDGHIIDLRTHSLLTPAPPASKNANSTPASTQHAHLAHPIAFPSTLR